MSKTKEPWWPYVKGVLRAYPEYERELARLRRAVKITPKYNANGGSGGISKPTEDLALQELPRKEQLRYEAVEKAIKDTLSEPDGKSRVSIIRKVYFHKSHTLQGAAESVHVSYTTAKRWHGDFIRRVGENLGVV